MVASWHGTDTAVILRSARHRLHPEGTIRRVEIDTSVGGAEMMGVNIAEAVALGRAVGRLPRRLVVRTIEGVGDRTGTGPSPAMTRAVDRAVAEVLALVEGTGR